jgi:hypothetical protein
VCRREGRKDVRSERGEGRKEIREGRKGTSEVVKQRWAEGGLSSEQNILEQKT